MEIVPGIHQVGGVKGNCFIIVRDDELLKKTGTGEKQKNGVEGLWR